MSEMERFDGSKWRMFRIDGGALVLTERGTSVLSHDHNLRHALHEYKKEALYFSTSGQVPFRRWFKSGGNSDIYQVGDHPVIVKEVSSSMSAWLALDRMDYLYSVCRRSLPTHIKVPDHYGALFARGLAKQYLIMEKVNEGITLEDLRDGNYDPTLKQLATEQFLWSKELLDSAIKHHEEREEFPANLLPDWHEGNVIVDLSTPTEEFPFTLWVIDQ